MSKISKILFKIFAGLCVCFIITITLFATGVIEPPVFLDIYSDKQYEETVSSAQKSQNSSNSNSYSNNSILISTSHSIDVNSVPSALTIKLSGDYLTAFEKAIKTLPTNDTNSQILIKVGLQILQSKTISYENKVHFYSLDYKNSGYKQGVTTYNLKDCISRINSGKYIYTDDFGFVRLAHSIACYTINSSAPESVEGLSGLYGYKGAYSQGAVFNSMSKLKSGAVIYDCLTSSGSDGRHVAMYLYTNGTEVVYMDQFGLHTGKFQNGSYIYSAINSIPYKFNKFKNYC